jgi:RNA-binding protein
MARDELKALRTRAHALNPTIVIGEAGVSDGLLDELDRQLAASELVKVRFSSKDRKERKEQQTQVLGGSEAQLVLAIGKIATVFRTGDARREANQAPAE